MCEGVATVSRGVHESEEERRQAGNALVRFFYRETRKNLTIGGGGVKQRQKGALRS